MDYSPDSLPRQTLLFRWLALASATGAAVTSGISLWLNNSLWLQFSLISSLLAAYCIGSLWQRIHAHNKALQSNVSQVVLHVQEVSDLRTELEKHKNFEVDLKRSKLAAESAAMAKSEFLATMSHEIRTPLNGIIPMLELLANSRLAPDQAEILNTAHNSALQMKQIVDDILDYSKLEANKLRLESTGINIREVVNSVMQMFQSQADSKRIGINIQLDPAMRLALRGDPVRLRQVLSNILSNAIKFTNKGQVSIRVKQISETRQHVMLRFEIKDSGIGISSEDASRLFKPFSQADTSTTRLYGGTGLGLVICKRIVDLMSGQIGVNSQAGSGSTFWFEIPLLKAVGDSQGTASDLKNANVLLFSSDPILSSRFEQANSIAGAKLRTAVTVFEAQRQLKESMALSEVTDIDLLIIDVNSGRQSAIQLQKAVLANPEYARLRIAMLHSTDTEPLELGRDPRRRIITRNMEMTQIIADLNKLLSGTTASTGQTRQETEPKVEIEPSERQLVTDQPYGRVLLVEDNPVNLLVAMRLLQLSNFECISAANGEVALDILQQQSVDLVLMDCQMPVMDGYRAARAWRAIETERGLPHLPIIAMTANAMAEDRQKCLDAGMDDYVSKPVDRKILQQTMLGWLEKSRQDQSAFVPAAAPIADTDSDNDSDTDTGSLGDDALSPLDRETLDELREMMGGEYTQLIRIYLEDSPKLVSQILAALSNQDSAALINPAHTLKSSSANLGAKHLSALALDMEKCAKAGDIQGPTQAAKHLIFEFEQVKTALNALLSEPGGD